MFILSEIAALNSLRCGNVTGMVLSFIRLALTILIGENVIWLSKNQESQSLFEVLWPSQL